MSALNIIGNGFDSYHGLPTAYLELEEYEIDIEVV